MLGILHPSFEASLDNSNRRHQCFNLNRQRRFFSKTTSIYKVDKNGQDQSDQYRGFFPDHQRYADSKTFIMISKYLDAKIKLES